VYLYTCHDYSEARDFITSSLSCSVRSLRISQSKDLLLVSPYTNSQKSIQTLIDFNPTKFDLIRILSFARFQPKLSSYISGACGSLGKIYLRSDISIYRKSCNLTAQAYKLNTSRHKKDTMKSSMNTFKFYSNMIKI